MSRRYRREKPFPGGHKRTVPIPLEGVNLLSLPLMPDPDAPELKHRLRGALHQFSRRRINRQQFDAALCDVDIAIWQQLQASTPQDTPAYADLCCLLAYCGIDYMENLCRLLESFRLVRWEPERYLWFFFEKLHSVDLKYLPGHLLLLYRKYRDPGLLDTLLDLDFEEGEAREAYLGIVAALWDECPNALLLSASQSLPRLCNILYALVRVATTVPDPEVWRIYYRTLQRAIHLREERIMRVAWQLMVALKRLQKCAD